jgi:hypothetical protein
MVVALFLMAMVLPGMALEEPLKDLSMHTGSTAFFLQDPADGQCLGMNGFTICDESAVWIITPRTGTKNYSFVSLFSSTNRGPCLDVKKGWLSRVPSVSPGSCSSKSSKNWNFQFTRSDRLKLINGPFHLTRGVPYHNSVSMTSTGDPIELRYQPTTIHDAGFFIKSADGLCFDGDHFRSCVNPSSLLWGVGVRFEGAGSGQATRFLHSFRDRSACLESRGTKVYRGQSTATPMAATLTFTGSCQSQSAWGWSLSHGRLEFGAGNRLKRLLSGGPRCVVRRAPPLDEDWAFAQIGGANETGAMRSCEESFEYLLMELPTTFR